MSIERIDAELCSGCGACVDACSLDVIRMDEESGKAVVLYPQECMLCGWCAVDCPQDAITLSPFKSAPLIVSWG